MCAYVRPWHVMWATTSWEKGEVHGEISVHVQWRKLPSRNQEFHSSRGGVMLGFFFFFKKKSLQSLHTRQFILDLWLIGALKAVIFKYKSLVFHYPICAIDITFIMGINRSSPETKLSFGATPYSKVGNMRGFRINYASLSWSSLLTRKLIFSTTIVNCMVFEYV